MNQVSRHTVSEAPMTHARYFGRIMKPRLKAPAISSGIEYGCPETPNWKRNRPSIMSASPKVSSSPYRWSSLYSHRSRPRSMAIPVSPTSTGAASSDHQ
ncbi:hypothetical protein D9M70_587050 [compost metagenome]